MIKHQILLFNLQGNEKQPVRRITKFYFGIEGLKLNHTLPYMIQPWFHFKKLITNSNKSQISIPNNCFQLTTPDSLIGFSQGLSNWLRCCSISVSAFDWLSTRFVKLKQWPHIWTTVNKKQIKQKYFNQFFNEKEGIIIYNNIIFHIAILFWLFLLSVLLTLGNEVTRCNLEVLFNWEKKTNEKTKAIGLDYHNEHRRYKLWENTPNWN